MEKLSIATASMKDLLKDKKSLIIKIAFIIIAIILIILIVVWVYSKMTLDDRQCTKMNNLYDKFPIISSTSDQFTYNLRDYYVKTAYNCCCAGTFSHNFVNICALKNCIKQGARCLDFQIYSLDDKPVIAVSSLDDFTTKETYNSIPFTTAMQTILDYAFSGSKCPCPADPLILHFRIMTTHMDVLDKMAKNLYNILERKLLGEKYSYEYGNRNIGGVPLRDLRGKIIIAVDKSLANPTNTKLDEYVNITSNSVFMRALRYHDVKYTPDMNELIEFNKKNMTICLPDLATKPDNPSSSLVFKYGCQFSAMCFQKNDTNLQYYNSLFEKAGSAFILKPKSLRYIPVTVPDPTPAPPEYSYESRNVETDYYSFKM